MLGECEGDGNAGVGDVESVVAVTTRHEYVGGTHGCCSCRLTPPCLFGGFLPYFEVGGIQFRFPH